MPQRKRKYEERIRKLLSNPPEFKGFSVKQISRELVEPWSTMKWYVGLLEARGEVEFVRVGRAKLYSLKRAR